MTCKTHKIPLIQEEPSLDSPLWESVPALDVDFFPDWFEEEPYKPKTSVKIASYGEGVALRFETDESPVLAACREQNGDVYLDSCMEFFFQPGEGDGRYLNVEINPVGTLHLGLGKDRNGRVFPPVDPTVFHIETRLGKEGGWALKYAVPFAFLREIYGELSPVWRANFYKCADASPRMHYASWNPVLTKEPDFHRPETFGHLYFT